ncbi:hypothetical protein [Methylococcus sp. EFPC2]|uniref:hypothetical protein n=1 Tax=Methylococcus sp. EFPC2 TaxID=2812648 RepID=UPI001966FF37|nr:hypothetical protein [Methylococcus sp. EFPC2]QSA97402.1 hypothetical protein JWZ97_00690 [Methylococcus sp. EFPC2]
MNKSVSMFAFSACIATFGAFAFAEEKEAPPPMPAHEGMGGMGGMGAMHGMSEEQRDAHMRQMQEFMLKSHDFMHQIRDAKDEKEQARLKDEWLQAMKQHMKSHQVPQQLKMHGMPEHGSPKK